MKVGLALSGGAARGIAHIGVLEYLLERKVNICCIAGTSAGSIVGALYCSGFSPEEIKKAVSRISWKDLVKLSFPRKGLIDSDKLLEIIKEHLGDIEFDDLNPPLLVNAVDLLSGEEVVFERGSVAEAVQASCAIPGIFSPVKRNEHLLVDGGLLDNLPAALLKNRGTDYIIAVDVAAQKPFQKEPGNIYDVLFQSYDIIRRNRDKPAYEFADRLIKPDLADIGMWDIHKADKIIAKGYKAAKEVLDDFDFDKKQGRIYKWLSKRKNRKRG